MEQAFVDKHKLDVAEGTTATTGAHVFRALTPAQRVHIITGIGTGESGRDEELMHQCAESGWRYTPPAPEETTQERSDRWKKMREGCTPWKRMRDCAWARGMPCSPMRAPGPAPRGPTT